MSVGYHSSYNDCSLLRLTPRHRVDNRVLSLEEQSIMTSRRAVSRRLGVVAGIVVLSALLVGLTMATTPPATQGNGVDVTTTAEDTTISGSGQTTYTVTVQNTGSSQQTFTIDDTELPSGWSVDDNQIDGNGYKQVTLDPWETKSVDFTVSPDGDSETGSVTFGVWQQTDCGFLCSDPKGEWVDYDSDSVTVDGDAPDISNVWASVDGQSVTVYADITDANAIEKTDVTFDTGLWDTGQTVDMSHVSGDTYSATKQIAWGTDFEYDVYARDEFGQDKETKNFDGRVSQNSQPQISNVRYQSDGEYVTFKADVTDDQGVEYVDVTVDPNGGVLPNAESFQMAHESGDTYAATVKIGWDTSFQYDIFARDTTSDEKTTETANYDGSTNPATKPTVDIQGTSVDGRTITVDVDASAGSGSVESVEVFWDAGTFGDLNPFSGGSTVVGDSPGSYTVTVPDSGTFDWGDDVKVGAKVEGEFNTVETTVTREIPQNSPPQISDVGAQADGQNVTFKTNVTDDQGLSKVDVTVDPSSGWLPNSKTFELTDGDGDDQYTKTVKVGWGVDFEYDIYAEDIHGKSTETSNFEGSTPKTYLEVGQSTTTTGSQVSLHVRNVQSDAAINWAIESEPASDAGSLLHTGTENRPYTTLVTEQSGTYTITAEVTQNGETRTLETEIVAQDENAGNLGITKDELMDKYAPVLYFHPDEEFFPTRYEAYVEQSSLATPVPPVNKNPSLLDLNDKGGFTVISPGSYSDDHLINFQDFERYPETVYGRVNRSVNYNGEEYTSINYWFFYVHDPKPRGTGLLQEQAKHTGDQEKISILVNESGPQWIAAQQHYGGEIRSWEKVNKTGQRPRLLIGQGSHPTFFEMYAGNVDSRLDGSSVASKEYRKLYQSQYWTLDILDLANIGIPGSTEPHPSPLTNKYFDPIGRGPAFTPNSLEFGTNYDTILLTENVAWSNYMGNVYTGPLPARGSIAMQTTFWQDKETWLSQSIAPSDEHFDAKIINPVSGTKPTINRGNERITADLTAANIGPQSGKFVLNVTAKHKSGKTYTNEYSQVIDANTVTGGSVDPVKYLNQKKDINLPIFPESVGTTEAGEWTVTVELASYTADIRDSDDVHDSTTFTFEHQPEVDGSLTFTDTPTGEVSTGETVSSTIEVANTGNVQHTYFVGYSAIGPDGEYYDNGDTTGKTVTLDPGEQKMVDVEWTVESEIPEGEYSLVSALWKESDRTTLNTQLDSSRVENAVSVTGTDIGTVTVTSDPTRATIEIDGNSISERTPASLELEDGDHTVTVSADGYESETRTVTVTPGTENTISFDLNLNQQGPSADAGGPYSVSAGNDVTLDSSGSYDPDGKIESTSWQVVGDTGSISDGTFTAPSSVDSETTVTVELTVTDNESNTDTDTATVTVSPDTGSASFDISITDTNSPVDAGSELVVDANVTNTGSASGTETIDFLDSSGNVVDTETVGLNPGNQQTVSLTWQTKSSDAGSGDITVRSSSDSATAPVQISSSKQTVFTIESVVTDGPVTAGEQLTVDATVENTGSAAGTQSVELADTAGVVVDTQTLTLDPGNQQTVTLTWQTESSDTGSAEITVRSDNDSATSPVNVESDSNDTAYTYHVPHTLNTKKLSDAWNSKLSLTATDSNATIHVDRRGNGSVDNKTTLTAGESTSVSTPEAGTVITASAPLSVVYRYGSADFTAWEDGRYRYGVPEVSHLGTEYYSPMAADTLAVAATMPTNVNIDANGNGSVDRTVSLSKNETTTLNDVDAGAHVTADAPVQVTIANARWSNMDYTYAASLLPVSSAQTSYSLPGHPSYNINDPTEKTRVALVGTQDGTTVSIGGQSNNLTRGEVATVRTGSSEASISADEPIVALYAVHIRGQDWGGSDYRENIGVMTPVGDRVVNGNAWNGKHFDGGLSAWSTYNLSDATVPDRPPTARINTSTIRPNIGETITFDARNSTAPDSSIDSYRWDFDDDGKIDATGETTTNTFNSTGDHRVTLTVTDNAGNSDRANLTVTVEDQTAPTAEAGSNQTVSVGNSTSFDGTASTDNVGIASYQWEFGDGTTASSAQVSHTYDTPGNYNVTLTVSDEAGNTDTDTASVIVENDAGAATLEASETTTHDQQTAPVSFTLTNTGENETGFILNVSLPTNWTIQSRDDAGGTWNDDENKWLWQRIASGENIKPNLTVAVPKTENGTYKIPAEALNSDSVVATTNATIRVADNLTIAEAIDDNNDGQISDFEVLEAINYWRTAADVPGTGGKSIGDLKILELIELWRNESDI